MDEGVIDVPLLYDRTVSGNGIISRLMDADDTVDVLENTEIDASVLDDAEMEGEFPDSLLYEKLDMIYDVLCQSVSGNGVEVVYVPTVSENSISVSVNSVEPVTEEKVENPLVSTRLADYSLTDSLLLLTVLLLLVANVLIVFYRGGGRH